MKAWEHLRRGHRISSVVSEQRGGNVPEQNPRRTYLHLPLPCSNPNERSHHRLGGYDSDIQGERWGNRGAVEGENVEGDG